MVEVDESVYLGARRQGAHVSADPSDHARELVRWHDGRAIGPVHRNPGLVPSELTRGDRGCMHLDEHLTCPHLWHGGALVAEDFWPSTLVGPYRLHRVQGADPGSELNAARSSDENSSGSSQAAKWPPLSTSWK